MEAFFIHAVAYLEKARVNVLAAPGESDVLVVIPPPTTRRGYHGACPPYGWNCSGRGRDGGGGGGGGGEGQEGLGWKAGQDEEEDQQEERSRRSRSDGVHSYFSSSSSSSSSNSSPAGGHVGFVLRACMPPCALCFVREGGWVGCFLLLQHFYKHAQAKRWPQK